MEGFPLSLPATKGTPTQTWVISRNNTGTLCSESFMVTKVTGMSRVALPALQGLTPPLGRIFTSHKFAQTRV